MAKPEVVISGISGYFPDSGNVSEFMEKLHSKHDFIRLPKHGFNKLDLLQRTPGMMGTIENKLFFDNSFFGLGVTAAKIMDPSYRLSIESAFAAVCDAGVNPIDISGSDTSVIATITNVDSEASKLLKTYTAILGINRSMHSNRISFALNLKGASYATSSSWNGVLNGLRKAKAIVESGRAPAVLVVGAELKFNTSYDNAYYAAGLISDDGKTCSFSDDAAGFIRSEACVAFFVQRKSDALRSYGEMVEVASSLFGDKEEELLDVMSAEYLTAKLRALYNKNGIDPATVSYVEASGIASKSTDAKELNGLADTFLEKRGAAPLYIGSVKSNIGHTGGASDGVALVKLLMAGDSGLIPPNVNYTAPNGAVPALVDGRMKVVTDETRLEGDILSLNVVSLVGDFSHGIFKRHSKVKSYSPQSGVLPPDGLPRLFCMTGREEEKTLETLKKVESQPVDPEFFGLTHRLFKHGIKNHIYRAFTVVNDRGVESREVHELFTGDVSRKRQVWWVFTGMGCQWPAMAAGLMALPVFAGAIRQCHAVLEPKGLHLIDIITTDDPKIFDNILHSFVGITAIQIALVETMRAVGLEADGMIGHSLGENGCAYADGCVNIEEAMLSAYYRGRVSLEAELISGKMAAVGLGYKEIEDRLPEGVEVACHNSRTSCTISGPSEVMEKYISHLVLKESVFARLVNVSDIAYHSSYIQPAGPPLLQYLKQVIREPKLRSRKWISTSVAEDKWGTELGKYCSAEYFTNNLLSPVLFEEGSKHIPRNAILVEVSPHGLLQAILKGSFPDAQNVPLTKKAHPEPLIFFLAALGRLYNRGVSLDLEKLYPPIEYPVARGTPPLSPLINWDWNDYKYEGNLNTESDPKVRREVAVTGRQFIDSILGYSLKGVPVLPFSAFIYLGVEQLSYVKNDHEYKVIQFTNSALKEFPTVDQAEPISLSACLQLGTGGLEISSGQKEVFRSIVEGIEEITLRSIPGNSKTTKVSTDSFYKYLKEQGIYLGAKPPLVKEIEESQQEMIVTVEWTGCLYSFLELILLLPNFSLRDLKEFDPVVKTRVLQIDLSRFSSLDKQDVKVTYSKHNDLIVADGIAIHQVESTTSFSKIKCFNVESADNLLYNDVSLKMEFQEFVSHVFKIVSNNSVHNEKKIELAIHTLHSDEEDVQLNSIIKEIEKHPSVNINLILHNEAVSPCLKERFDCDIAFLNDLGRSYFLKQVKKGLFQESYFIVETSHMPDLFAAICSEKKYSLCKLKEDITTGVKIISTQEDSWETDVRDLLLKDKNRKVYLVTLSTLVTEVLYVLKKCDSLPNAQKLRLIFHGEQNFVFEQHLDQFSKNLRINVLINGQWGFVSTRKELCHKKNQNLIGQALYKFSELRMSEDFKIKSIGLGFDRSQNESKLVEYSGSTGGVISNICGIGEMDIESMQVIPDPILKWHLPNNWNHENICTVLFPYVTAFAILKSLYLTSDNDLNELLKVNVLVHRPSVPLSRALITVSLHHGHNVFIACQDKQEVDVARTSYPQVPSMNIFEKRPNLQIMLREILLEKQLDGFNCILNPVADKEFYLQTNRLLSTSAYIISAYVQLDLFQAKDTFTGLEMFLTNGTLYGLKPSDYIKSLSDVEKDNLRFLLEEAFNNQVVKPIKYLTVSNECYDTEATSILSEMEEDMRLVVSNDGAKPSTSNELSNWKESVVIVVVNNFNEYFDYLMDWLFAKDLKELHLIFNTLEDLLLFEARQKSLSQNLKSMDIYLNVLKRDVNTENGIREKMSKLLSPAKYIFIIGKETPSRLKIITSACQHSRILYFSPEIHRYFESYSKNCIQVVHHTEPSCKDAIIPLFNKIMSSGDNILILDDVTLDRRSKIRIDNSRLSIGQHMPGRVEEVEALGERLREKSWWKEVRTQTARSGADKLMSPVLVIPSLRQPDPLSCLVSKLYHPAYLAQISTASLQSIHQTVQQLYQGLSDLKSSVFTIVCSDWSYMIGINLGKLLESDGRRVVIVLFDSAIDWRSEELFMFASNSVPTSRINELKVKRGLETLKRKLDLVRKEDVSFNREEKLRGLVLLIKYDMMTRDNICRYAQQNSQDEVKVVTLNKKNYIEAVNSVEAANFINSATLTEYKDTARKLPQLNQIERDIVLHPFSQDTWTLKM